MKRWIADILVGAVLAACMFIILYYWVIEPSQRTP
jgi:uncharacterized BrkB/YihY/UPF0761 family membrane protein